MYEIETALLRASATGDAWSFSEFYDLTAPRVYGVVSSIVGDGELADSVVRDVFLTTWRQARRFDEAHECALATVLRTAYCLASRRAEKLEAA